MSPQHDVPRIRLSADSNAFAAFTRALRYGFAPLEHRLTGIPVMGDRMLPVGQAATVTNPIGGRVLLVGIPSRTSTEAVQIVRKGMADVLAWLAEPEPFWLTIATAHYRTTTTDPAGARGGEQDTSEGASPA